MKEGLGVLSEAEATFFQAVTANRTVSLAQAASLFFPDKNREDLEQILANINPILLSYGFRLVTVVAEGRGEKVVMLEDTGLQAKEEELHPYTGRESLVAGKCLEILAHHRFRCQLNTLCREVANLCLEDMARKDVKEIIERLLAEEWLAQKGELVFPGPCALPYCSDSMAEKYPEVAVICATCGHLVIDYVESDCCLAKIHDCCKEDVCSICKASKATFNSLAQGFSA